MILIDKDGQYILKNGIKDKSFFIYPYQQIYTQQWSNDLKKDHCSTVEVDRFDTRNQCKINLFLFCYLSCLFRNSIFVSLISLDRYGL